MGAKPPSSAGPGRRLGRLALAALLAAVVIWFVPLFHVVRGPGAAGGGTPAPAREGAALAEIFWSGRLQPSALQAPAAVTVLTALHADFRAGRARYAHPVGLGGLAYFYVSGEGRVIRRDGDQLLVALGDGAPGQPVVALQLGPVFGNTVRDGTGLLNVNDSPSLEAYNALAAELDRLVETRVLPVLREHAAIGTRIAFAGCAEAPEDAGDSTPLAIVPVRAAIP